MWSLPWYRMLFVYVAIEAAHGAVDIALFYKRRERPVCSFCHRECNHCRNDFHRGLQS